MSRREFQLRMGLTPDFSDNHKRSMAEVAGLISMEAEISSEHVGPPSVLILQQPGTEPFLLDLD